MSANNRPTKKPTVENKQNAKCYPPFIDAYKEFFDEPIDFKTFKEAMKCGASEWGEQAVGKLFMNQVITRIDDLEHTPVYVGYFGGNHYGVFAKVKDGYLDYDSFEVRGYNYPYEWDLT